MKLFHRIIFFLIVASSVQVSASEPDTLVIFDAAAAKLGVPPAKWENILPKKELVYTNYSIERSIDGQYLRAQSGSSASFLELDMSEIDVSDYSTLVWEWKVDRFRKSDMKKTRSPMISD